MYKPKNELLILTHRFLVRACETERGLPKVFNLTMKTLWPDTEAERHIDYTPERTHVTYCKPTGSQIDDHARALQMVAVALDDVIDRRITWAVAQSAAFRERGPKWKKLAFRFKDMGMGYPKSEKVLKRRYEDALLSILHQQLYKNCYKPMGSQGRENER
jgi:hypothetical protein